MSKKKPKIIIMKPSHRQGAWLHGVDEQGFQKVVPVSCVGKIRTGLPRGFRVYTFREKEVL